MELSREDLEAPCSRCGGTGQDSGKSLPSLPTPSGPNQRNVAMPAPCPECRGRKTVPTASGQAILDFLKGRGVSVAD